MNSAESWLLRIPRRILLVCSTWLRWVLSRRERGREMRRRAWSGKTRKRVGSSLLDRRVSSRRLVTLRTLSDQQPNEWARGRAEEVKQVDGSVLIPTLLPLESLHLRPQPIHAPESVVPLFTSSPTPLSSLHTSHLASAQSCSELLARRSEVRQSVSRVSIRDLAESDLPSSSSARSFLPTSPSQQP
jgi:hypothetical protein